MDGQYNNRPQLFHLSVPTSFLELLSHAYHIKISSVPGLGLQGHLSGFLLLLLLFCFPLSQFSKQHNVTCQLFGKFT